MAPKRNTKRAAAQEVKEAPAKRAKVDTRFEAVEAAIRQAASVPEGCRQMLLASLPHSLGVAADERQEVQAAVVKMVEEAVLGVEAALEEALEAESAKVAGAEALKGELDASAAAAETAALEARGELAEKKQALAEAAEIVQGKQALVAEKRAAQEAGDAALVKAEESKVAIEKVVESHWKTIVEGDWSANDPEAHYTGLLAVVGGTSVDASLLTALPAVCNKPAAERGSFDKMVIDQLEKNLADRIAELSRLLDEGASAKQERAAAVEVQEQALAAAREAQLQAAADFKAAEEGSTNASAAAKAAADALAGFGPEFKKATAAKDERASALEHFRLHNRANFELLRDRVARPVEAPEPIPAMPPAPEALTPEAAVTEASASELKALAAGEAVQPPVAEVGGA